MRPSIFIALLLPQPATAALQEAHPLRGHLRL